MPTTSRLHAAAAGLVLVTIFAGTAFAQSAEDAFGRWLDAKTGTHIEAYPCGKSLCAKIVKATIVKTKQHAPGLKDVNNPDESLRGRAVEGLVIMEGAARHATKPSWSAKLYSPSKGKSFNGTITVKSKDALVLQGCIVWPLCQSATWTRVAAAAAPAPKAK